MKYHTTPNPNLAVLVEDEGTTIAVVSTPNPNAEEVAKNLVEMQSLLAEWQVKVQKLERDRAHRFEADEPTVTMRYDLSPAAIDCKIRNRLIEMGWTPPAVAPASKAAPDPRTPANVRVNSGALRMALNVLRRAGKNEVADELEKTAVQGDAD